MRLGINQQVHECLLATLLVQELFPLEREKSLEPQDQQIPVESNWVWNNNSPFGKWKKIGISEQLIHGPPDDHDCLLGLPFFFFWLSMYLPIFLSLFGSSRIYIPLASPVRWGWPLGCLVSCAFLPNAGVTTRSSICHNLALAASSLTIWFSFNLLQRWGVQPRFLFHPEFQVFLSFTNPVNIGLLRELGVIWFYFRVPICDLQLKAWTSIPVFQNWTRFIAFVFVHWSWIISS